jgi:hypothetical protein
MDSGAVEVRAVHARLKSFMGLPDAVAVVGHGCKSVGLAR